MLRSMFSGVSGLRSHQTMMDTVGNNISNVNTTGYKSTRATFQEALTQVTRGATAPIDGGAGGVNPMQLGLGTRVAAIDGNFGQGATQSTGRVTDLAIQGDGFFVVNTAEGIRYTRAGAFNWDAPVDNGAGQMMSRLVGPNGERVQGWPTTPPVGAPGDLEIELAEYSDVAIGNNGVITGRDDTGTEQVLGVVALATFPNPNGLTRVGGSLFNWTANAGPAAIAVAQPGTAGFGTLQPGTLEMSNVDLAQEFTNLIMAQRGFQANARTITTSDEMLTELVNMKR